MFPCEILWVQSTLVGGEEASALGSRDAVRSAPFQACTRSEAGAAKQHGSRMRNEVMQNERSEGRVQRDGERAQQLAGT